MNCHICCGTGRVLIFDSDYQIAIDSMPCSHCLETGVEPPDPPDWLYEHDEREEEVAA